MAKSYPESYSRYNGDYLHYADIAMKHYLLAKKEYNCFEKELYLLPIEYSCDDFESNCIITVVFATMAIESFLNDYAAACLGDSNFYDSFDRLDLLAKFQLVAKCILEKEFEKSRLYYSSLKELIKSRNLFVHNKSIAMDYDKLASKAVLKTIEDKQQIEGKVKPLFKECENAIKAIVEVARYFEENDENSHAYLRLLGNGFIGEKHAKYEIRKEIYKEFKIKQEKR